MLISHLITLGKTTLLSSKRYHWHNEIAHCILTSNRGQCTRGHSCKKSSRYKLKRIINGDR